MRRGNSPNSTYEILLSVFCILTPASLPVRAAGEVKFTPNVTIPGSQFQQGTPVTMTSANPGKALFGYIQAIYTWAIRLIGALTVIMIIVGGFQWMLAAGNTSKIEEAKKKIIDSFIALALILAAVTILNFVNPSLTSLPSLNLTGVNQTCQWAIPIYSGIGGYSLDSGGTISTPICGQKIGENFMTLPAQQKSSDNCADSTPASAQHTICCCF